MAIFVTILEGKGFSGSKSIAERPDVKRAIKMAMISNLKLLLNN